MADCVRLNKGLGYKVSALLFRLALRLARGHATAHPVAVVVGIERLVISHPEANGPSHATLRVRAAWEWHGRSGVYAQSLHVRLGAQPVIEDSHAGTEKGGFPCSTL